MSAHDDLSPLSDGDAIFIDDEESDDQNTVVEASEHADTIRFVSEIWSADASGALQDVHMIAKKSKPKGFKHYAFYSVRDAVDHALSLSAGGENVYFAPSSFVAFNGTNKNNRTRANACRMRSFWMDIDCGAGKPYADQAKGLEALKTFCRSVGLPKPSYIIGSGNGLHCYWHFDERIKKEDWSPSAERLKVLAQAKGFHADPSRTADSASLMRIPGTMNWKDPNNPKPVVILSASGARDLKTFLAALNSNAHQSPKLVNATSKAVNDDPSSALEIIKHCPTLAHFEAVRGVVSEPFWRNALGVLKHTSEGEPLCHQWSMGDPRYDVSETQAKIDKWTKGPALCSTFRGLPDAQLRRLRANLQIADPTRHREPERYGQVQR